MSEEEKKVIEQFKNFIIIYQDVIEDEYSDYEEKESAKEYQEVSEKILNLIEKQQKEIEKEHQNWKDLLFEYGKKCEELNNSISKDKIREKIKELENKNEENKIELAKGIDTLNFDTIENARNNIAINVNVRDILQELLEEN